MVTRLTTIGTGASFSDEILDEMEGEALVIVEHPDRYAAITVSMARNALEMIHRMRRRDHGLAAQPA